MIIQHKEPTNFLNFQIKTQIKSLNQNEVNHKYTHTIGGICVDTALQEQTHTVSVAIRGGMQQRRPVLFDRNGWHSGTTHHAHSK